MSILQYKLHMKLYINTISRAMSFLICDKIVQLTNYTVHYIFQLNELGLNRLQFKVLGQVFVEKIIVMVNN